MAEHGERRRARRDSKSVAETCAALGRRALLLLALSLAPVVLGYGAPASAHEEVDPPKPVEIVDGTWPPGPTATHDVVVQLLVTVSEQGEVTEATVDVTLGPSIDEAALVAARRWRFEPARRAGVAIPARARIAVRFHAPPPPPPAPISATAPASAEATPVVPVAPVEPPPSPAPEVAAEAESEGEQTDEQTDEDDDGYGAVATADQPARSASEVVRDRKTLAIAPHRTGNDMLRLVPGLFITQHGGEGKAAQIFYRGFDAVHGQDLEVWVGGAPVNDVSNLHGQGYADLNFVIPEVVRTMRALPGSYDPRQGDFAVAGTVRFELGLDEPGFAAKASYGSFGSSRYYLAYRPHGASEGTFAAAEFYNTDGFGPSRAAQRASAIAQATWKVGKATRARILLTGYTSHFDSAGVLRLTDIERGAVDRFATYDPSQGGASTRMQLVGEVKRQTGTSTLSIAPFLVLRSLRLNQNFTGYLTDPNGDLAQQLNDDLVLGGTAFYRRKQRIFSPDDQLEIGVLMRTDWIDQSQRRLASTDERVTAEEVDARVRAIDVAGYFDVALHPLSFLTLRGGVRIDGLSYATEDHGALSGGQARSSQGTHFGKKATLELRPLAGLTLVTSYGEGFRSPQARSLAESQTTPFTRVRSVEGGLRYRSDRLAASLAGFHTRLSDDLVFDQATVRNETVPATARTGATVDLVWQPLSWIHAALSSTYTHAVFRAGNRSYTKGDLVPYAPQLVSRADVGVSPLLASWLGRDLRVQLGSALSHLARRPLPYGQLGHDIFLVDLQANIRWGEGALGLKVYNLLDTRWYDGEFMFASNWSPSQSGASLVPLRHVTVGAPRTLMASLEIYL